MTQQSIETTISIPIRILFTPHAAEKTIIHPVDKAYEGHPVYVDIDKIETPKDLEQYILNQYGDELHEECMEWLRENGEG